MELYAVWLTIRRQRTPVLSSHIYAPQMDASLGNMHRHREDHKCLCSENNKILSELDTTKNPGKLLVSSSDSQTNSSEHKTNDVKKNLGEIHNKRADMIAIMRLKSKLKSEVPNSDRIFLFLIQDSRREPVMVSKKWSIGRCVYEIAKYFGIQNNNGKFDAKILRMYSASDRQVPLPMTDEAQKHLNCSEDIILRRDD
ncbi:unnamed protein product [Dracunculus medinensis]|uniref:RBD domain-containing protein n=1 Tax=Dracunculus medinensis TaxID=318479 RepID=A0A0N4U1J9_DRAME|nr:unnamed protein product [Dracunculus medinensis]